MKSQVQKQNSVLENNKQEHLLTLNNISTTITDYCQLTVDKFGKEGFNSLTVIQQKALPVITRKVNCLLVAPTGSGKTEAAVLPIFAMLSSDQRNYKSKIRAIYITPLRALNNDVLRRIIKYAESENLRIQIRHGDTTTLAKKKIVEDPPDILITTPESLAVILTIEKMLDALRSLEWIIVDEIHELISNERGAHLSIGLERLQAASLQQVTRIGLSATLGNLDEAEYIGTILKNQNDIKVDVHHGSLSKDVREDTEVRLREGMVDIVVCTSSLELGLDIGSVELVIHYGSPRQVSKLMQRIGRSRHTQGNSAKGLIVTNNPDDEIEALAIIRRMRRRSIEEQVMHNQALDVVAHHLVGLALQTRSQIILEDAFDLITKAYPFSNISFYDIEGCIDLLDANRIIKYEREDGSYKRRLKAYKFYFENLSMIPYVLKFEVIDSISNRRIGTLDQQFVGDYGEKGNVFVLKGSQWRVISVDERRMQVNVEPLHGIAINVPYWVGETIPVDYETAEEVGLLRNQAVRKAIKLCTSSTIEDTFNSIKVIPDSKNIVIESSVAKNTVIIHSTFGTKVNNTLASILSAILSSQLGYEVETKSDPYRIMLSSSAKIGKGHIESIFNDTYDFEPVIIASLTGTHHINWKVWMVAKRFGMISREAVYDRKVARLIYDRYAKTPISKESIRELLHDKYDIPLTKKVLTDIKNGIIKLHWSDVVEFSSLGEPILEHSGKKFSASPLSIEKGVIELIKERLEKTKHRLICIRCGKWERTMETKETPETISCPTCKSKLITATFWSDNDMAKIIIKRLTGGKLSKDENHKFNRAWKVASLINNFGRKALIVLAGYGIGADTAARILRNYIDDEEIYRSIYEAEKQYVMTHRFWND